MFNLHASIVPGMSAAGFKLGQLFSDLSTKFKGARTVEYNPAFDLNRAIDENTGILIVNGFGRGGGLMVFFGPEIVRLSFTSSNVLGCIYVYNGYLGSYRNAMIGSPLSSVSAYEPVAFDGGDEMYYRVDQQGEYLPGLAIVATEADPEEHAATEILGFCVHDWSVFRSAT